MKVIDKNLNNYSLIEYPDNYRGLNFNYVFTFANGNEKVEVEFKPIRQTIKYRNGLKIIEDTPKEDKKIKRIEERESGWWPNMADGNVSTLKQAINEIIDKVNKL